MVAEGGEGENPLPFSLTVWGWGGGGVGGVSRLRFPPGPHLRSSRFSRHPRLRQAPTRRFAKNRNLGGFCGPRPLVGRAPSPGGPGPKPPGDLAHRPLRPGSRHVDFLQAKFLSCCVSNPWVQNPIGGRWMVSEGGALQSHVPSSLQHFSRWAPSPRSPANKPRALHPGSLAASTPIDFLRTVPAA